MCLRRQTHAGGGRGGGLRGRGGRLSLEVSDGVGVGVLGTAEAVPVDAGSGGVIPAQRECFTGEFFEGVSDDHFVFIDDLISEQSPPMVVGNQASEFGVASSDECCYADLYFGPSGYVPRIWPDEHSAAV